MEGIFNVLYTMTSRLSGNGDDVEAYGKIDSMVVDVCIGCLYKVPYFLVGDSISYIAKIIVFSCFYFNECYYTILLCYDVDLFMPNSPIAFPNSISASHEVRCSIVFAYNPELIMLGHCEEV